MSSSPTQDPSFDSLLRPDDEGEPHVDLCDQYAGKYVDIVRSDVDQTWCGLYDNHEVVGSTGTRETAREQLIEWLKANVTPVVVRTAEAETSRPSRRRRGP